MENQVKMNESRRTTRRLMPKAALLLLLAAAVPPAHAADFEAAMEQGEKARKAGQFAKAAQHFAEARKARPGAAEAWYLSGLTEAYQKHYKDAIRQLEEALRLAPQDQDIRLALARTHSWKGDHAAAQRLVDEVLAASPGSTEARILKGRLHFYQGEEGRAKAAYEAVLAKEPSNAEAKEGLAQLARAEAEARPYLWQIDAGYATSRFSRVEQENWRDGSLQLNYRLPDNNTLLHGRYSLVRRFGDYNRFYEVGADYLASPALSGYAAFAFSPDGAFLPEHRVRAGGAARVIHQHDMLGDTFLTLDAIYDDYATGDVKTFNPGLQYYVTGDVWVSLKHINVLDADNTHLKGWFFRTDWQALDTFRVNAGVSDAPETVDGFPVDTRSYFGGLAWDITQTATIYLGLSRDDRKDSYINRTVSSGLSVKF